MKQLWQQLEKYLSTHDPEVLEDLNPPATDAQIRELERTIGIQLPADFIKCLKIHDGQAGKAKWLFDGHEFLSSEKILMEWAVWVDLLVDGEFDDRAANVDEEITTKWWCKGWVPFSSNGVGDHYCLDLEPTILGNSGQVIQVIHDMPTRALKSSDFGSWFENFLSNKTGG